MKQTAVDWFEYQLKDNLGNIVINQNWQLLEDLIEQAKAMEKQQIVIFFEKGYENGAGVSDEDPIYHGGNYYNKTFKSE